MSEVLQIRLCGYGGQGIVLMGVLLGEAAVREGLWAAGSNSYGAQARGSACRADVVLSRTPLEYPHLLQADLLVAMSQSAYEAYLPGLADGGRVLYDSSLVNPDDARQRPHAPIPATRVAIEELGKRQAANMVMLGGLLEIAGLVSMEALVCALEDKIPAHLREINVQAFQVGRALGRRVDPSLRDAFARAVPWRWA